MRLAMSNSDPEEVAASADEAHEDAGTSSETGAGSGELGEVEEDLEIEVEGEGSGAVPKALDPLEQLQAEVKTLEAAKAENYERFVRVSADLENFRKRSRKELSDARIDEKSKVLKDILPVIDNLERALSHAQSTETEATKSIIEGVNLVLRSFQQTMERHKVRAIEAVGKPFDPALHEAVSQAPSADYPPGTVVSALQSGYTIEERLLRPALVVVSVAMPSEAPASEAAADQSEAEESSATAESSDASEADEQ